jgi:hypothetical protein
VLSLVVPVFNEEERVHLFIEKFLDQLHLIQIETSALVNQAHPKKKIVVKINKNLVETITIINRAENRIDIAIPLRLQENIRTDGFVRIKFHFLDAISPKEIGMNEDGRKLALGLQASTVR